MLLMPGLNVEILAPSVTAPASEKLQVTAWVTMMCGCKIAPSSAWLPSQFEISAIVSKVGGERVGEQVLAFETTSTFTNKKPFCLPGAGDYQLIVNAVQAAAGTVGSATSFFSLASSTGGVT